MMTNTPKIDFADRVFSYIHRIIRKRNANKADPRYRQLVDMVYPEICRFLDIPEDYVRVISLDPECNTESLGTYMTYERWINLSCVYSASATIYILAHEMTHAKQEYENRLVYFGASHGSIRWRNIPICTWSCDVCRYHERPWEKEANQYAFDFCNHFLKTRPGVVKHINEMFGDLRKPPFSFEEVLGLYEGFNTDEIPLNHMT